MALAPVAFVVSSVATVAAFASVSHPIEPLVPANALLERTRVADLVAMQARVIGMFPE